MVLVTRANAKAPVPVLMMFGRASLPRRRNRRKRSWIKSTPP